MIHNHAASYDGQTTYPDDALKLETYTTRVQVRAVKMKLTLRKKKPLVTIEQASQKPPEHTELPERLDHYLFW